LQLICVFKYNDVTPMSFAFWSHNLLKKIPFKGLNLTSELIQVLWGWSWVSCKERIHHFIIWQQFLVTWSLLDSTCPYLWSSIFLLWFSW
jgi:hypothetical protein